MGKVLDLSIPTEQFALGDTFASLPDATVETVPVAAHGPHEPMSFLSVSSSNTSRLDALLRSDETTKGVTRLSGNGGRLFYRIRWRMQVQIVIDMLLQTTGSLLSANGTSDEWKLCVMFPEQVSVSTIYENWREHGIDPTILRINGVSGMVGHDGLKLSQCQHDTLLKAFEMDYYDVPRGVNLDGLAEELHVSHQALSERLRRGHRNLVQTTLYDSPTPIRNQQ